MGRTPGPSINTQRQKVQALRFTSNCMLSQFSCTSSIVVLQSMPCPAATIFKEDNTLSTIFIFFVNRFFAFVFSSILYFHFHFLVVFWICVSCSLRPSVELCCLMFVSRLCLQLHSNGFFYKKNATSFFQNNLSEERSNHC